MNEVPTRISSDEEVLWEGSPSKEKCNKISRLVAIFTVVSMGIIAAIFVGALFPLIGFSWIFIIMLPILIGFVGFFMLWGIVSIEGKKWKWEHYQITNKRVIKSSTTSMLWVKTDATEDISVDNLVQCKVYQSFGDRFFNLNTGQIWFFIEYSTFPKMFFSHIIGLEKVKSALDTLITTKRRRELKRKKQNPYSSIDFFQQKNTRSLYYDFLIKVGVVILVLFGPYFLFRWMFYMIQPFGFGLVDFIVIFGILTPIASILILVFIVKLVKNVSIQFYMNNIGVFKEGESECLLELSEICQFLIKQPLIFRLLKIDSPTFIFFKGFAGKAVLKIPAVKNYQLLRDQLFDVLYLKASSAIEYEQVIEKDLEKLEKKVEKIPTELESAGIDSLQPRYDYLYSYLTPDEKVMQIFAPNKSSVKKNILIMNLPILLVIVVVFIPLILLPIMMFELLIMIAMIIIPLSLCNSISTIYMYYKLKKTEYILTTQKIIINYDKKIEFIPLIQIESAFGNRRFSDRIFKLNTGNVTLVVKQTKPARFLKVPKIHILQSVENHQEIYDLIMELKKYVI